MKSLHCPGCNQNKSSSEFHKDSSRTRGFQTYCKLCHKERAADWWSKKGKESYQKHKQYQQEWRKKNPERYAKRQWRYHIKRKYGMSEAEFQARVSSQECKCACCGDVAELVVDHCHTANKVRDLLCQPCNKGLGCFSDNPDRLRAAIKYLEKHNGEV